ncbi:DUF4268 domain-containing protein [Mucilaginibacter terrenus]|uniref:DUF4268 domain-containing protein n=1 Tax=Mucilaginibacter terrenus TaxID=2482727 RepID=A0A3E2NVC9_9SPHI|nr:DUF4268 domain-containing protein [Mucilaginibacter terrenus]RFZ84976.1 DUF4268 domain-containing protein [Mucilaginibacter terrenus]
MYSKEQASQLRQEFWTTFGQYMRPVLSAEGLRINWINYKTGVRNIAFKMDADNKRASVGIELNHADPELQELYFEELKNFRTLLHNTLEEEWDWVLHTSDDSGRTVTRIFTEIQSVSIYQKEDWPKLISFFKPRMIALDDFWSNAKPAFEA